MANAATKLTILYILVSIICKLQCAIGARLIKRRTPTKAKFDTGVGQFSPEGDIPQIQYAHEAVKKGALIVGVECKDGAILVCEKRTHSPLMLEQGGIDKINVVHDGLAAALAGLLPDGRLAVQRARQLAQEHWFMYNEPIGAFKVVAGLAELALGFNRYSNRNGERDRDEEDGGVARLSRPLGLGLLLAGPVMEEASGRDQSGRPKVGIYHLEPSGVHLRWRAKALGQGATELEALMERGAIPQYQGASSGEKQPVTQEQVQRLCDGSLTMSEAARALIPLLADQLMGGSGQPPGKGNQEKDKHYGQHHTVAEDNEEMDHQRRLARRLEIVFVSNETGIRKLSDEEIIEFI